MSNDPDGYCILHSEGKNKDIKAFKEKVEERIATTGARINLIGCYFPRGLEVKFVDKRFEKPVDFVEATFTKGANFREATFTQEANFNWATFTQGTRANFRGATFTEGAHFNGATFAKGDFSWATFTQGADFMGATFTEGANFSRATFTQGDFVDTSFEKGVLFNQAEFKERVRFEVVERGARRVFFGPGSSFQYTRFPGEVVFQGVDLSNCSFLHSNINKVDFRYCEFAERPSRVLWFDLKPRQNVLRDELEADGEVKGVESGVKDENVIARDVVPKQSLFYTVRRFFASLRMTREEKKLRGKNYEPVRRLYLELKRNFEDKKDWNTAGDFHYGEMECRRKMKGWWGRNLLSLEAVYYWASGYGERPWRALGWLILLPLLFTSAYYLLDIPPRQSFRDYAFLHYYFWELSVKATFLFLHRIGDTACEPIRLLGKLVYLFQSLLCTMLIALFILALRRKVKR